MRALASTHVEYREKKIAEGRVSAATEPVDLHATGGKGSEESVDTKKGNARTSSSNTHNPQAHHNGRQEAGSITTPPLIVRQSTHVYRVKNYPTSQAAKSNLGRLTSYAVLLLFLVLIALSRPKEIMIISKAFTVPHIHIQFLSRSMCWPVRCYIHLKKDPRPPSSGGNELNSHTLHFRAAQIFKF